jgi:hypothetical protein
MVSAVVIILILQTIFPKLGIMELSRYIWNEVHIMNILIDKGAAEYIKKHSKDSSIILHIKSEGNCCVSVPTPEVLFGKPEITERFDLFMVDGISVYVSKGIEAKDGKVRIFVKKFLWVEDLAVDGLNVSR